MISLTLSTIDNFKPLNKVIEKDTRKMKDIPYSRFGGVNTVKIPFCQKLFTDSVAISIKIPILVELNQHPSVTDSEREDKVRR